MIPIVLLLISYITNHGCSAATIDDDTPIDVQTIVRHRDGRKLGLVMSDEFNKENRSFSKGMDPMFEAIEKPDHSNEAIQYYNSGTEYVTTTDGNLVILTKAIKTHYWDDRNEHSIPERVSKNYTSGMVQSWNKFCFTGGILEMSIELPGESDSGGIWPAAWLMGNLARATFEKTTDYIWPWSYNTCGEIVDLESKQEISACDPNPGFGMNPYQGRGAPEIDIFEVMPGHEMPGAGNVKAFMSSSLQIAPGVPKSPSRPKNGRELNTSFEWYDGLVVGEEGSFNSGFWGQECGPEKAERVHKYMEDAISVNTDLEATHFKKHHVYKIEWQPGKGGYLYWYLDEEVLFGIEGESVEKLTGGIIPEEPMYLILNTAISHRWGMPEPCPVDSCSACWHCYDCTNPVCQCSLPNGMKGCRNLPAQMRVDYIRLYQDTADPTHTVDCSPPSHPTADFIAAHAERYKDWEPKLPPPAVSTVQVTIAVIAALAVAGLAYFLYKALARPSRGADYISIPETAP